MPTKIRGQSRVRFAGGWLAALLLAGSGLLVQAVAAVQPVFEGASTQDDSARTLQVPLFKSRVIRLPSPIARVSVGNPDVADIVILKSRQLYVLGKDPGTTNVLLWDPSDDLIAVIAVEVSHDLETLKAKLFELLPDERIEVYSSQRSIVLRGTVSSALAMDTALRIARGFLAQVQTSAEAVEFEQEDSSRREDKTVGEVVNLIQVAGAQQVMLEVKVAEIQRKELKRLNAQFNALSSRNGGWSWGGVNGGATFPDVEFEGSGVSGRLPVLGGTAPWGPAIDEFAPNAMAIQNHGLFASFLSDSFLFNLAIDAARGKGLARILAEPTLTTLTGQEATFVSGGEFGYVVQGGNNGNSVDFKDFGIGLNFLPVVLGPRHINVRVNVSVSDLVSAPSELIPALLTKRSAQSVVELAEGQTMAIAGLISESTRDSISRFPGLGDLPILGQLFSSREFQNDETELVILVTPHLAQPVTGKVRLPTDGYTAPSDVDFFLLGRRQGKAAAPGVAAGGVESDYGQRIE